MHFSQRYQNLTKVLKELLRFGVHLINNYSKNLNNFPDALSMVSFILMHGFMLKMEFVIILVTIILIK